MLRRHRKYLKAIITGISLLLSNQVSAINITDVAGGVTPAQMLTVLQGSGVSISNLTITAPGGCNSNQGVGLFTNGTTAVGAGPVLSEPTGVVLSSGAIAGANRLDSSNDVANVFNFLCGGAVSDTDMVALESATASGEYAAIEFDVVPQSAILAIPFQFGSDEFPEYVCSTFNDVVGIFVRGPGIAGPYSGGYENFAKTSTGDLSSINWVNTGVQGTAGGTNATFCTFPNGSFGNTAFYTDNSSGNPNGGSAAVAATNANLEMDGFTNKLFQPISVVAGQTYHVKIAVADAGDRLWDSAAFIHPLFSTDTFSGFDFGDAPDSFGTLTSNGGPSHGVDSSIFMGASAPDNEITGIPTVNADGDDLNALDDEDGVSSFPVLLTSATSYSVNVNVSNNSGNPARLVGWIDFNQNGAFESGEGTQTNVANGTTGATVALNWPTVSGLVNGNTYARIRLSSDIGLSVFTTGSAMSDGEVEDYTLPIAGASFTKYVSTDPACTDTLQSLTVTVGTNVYYCYTVTNTNAFAFTVTASSDNQGHDLSALETAYAASASNTVVIGPLVAGGAELPNGVTIVNDASVTANILGNSVTVNDSASLTVTLTPPASGMKQLYFGSVTDPGNLTRDPTNSITDSTSANIAKDGGTMTLNQGIVFTAASPFTITGGTDVIVQLRIRRRANRASNVQVELFNGNTGTAIGAPASSAITAARNVWQTLLIPVTIPADVTLGNNDYIQLVITNTSTGGGGRNIQVRTLEDLGGGVIEKSQLQIQSSTVINVDSMEVYANPWPDLAQYPSYIPSSTVSIRATVSDPFGNADITGATLTIDSPTANQLTDVAMTAVDTPSATTKVFQYLYDISTNPEDGFWQLSVTANEGFETTVSHTETRTMIVGTSNMTVSKNSAVLSDPVNATAPKAIPGAIVEYTIGVTNTGFGYVDQDSFIITDPLSSSVTFFFGSPFNPANIIDGSTPSGLTVPLNIGPLADPLDDIDYSNDGGSSFIEPMVDGNGFDITVPPINYIRINPKGEFNGSDGVNNPSMELKFRVRVD